MPYRLKKVKGQAYVKLVVCNEAAKNAKRITCRRQKIRWNIPNECRILSVLVHECSRDRGVQVNSKPLAMPLKLLLSYKRHYYCAHVSHKDYEKLDTIFTLEAFLILEQG